jgi:hypothetical protein
MITRLLRLNVLILVLLAARPDLAASQLPLEVEAGSFIGGAVFVSDPSEQLTIFRQNAPPIVVRGGELSNGIAVGVSGGLRVAERLGLEGMYAWVPGLLRAREGLEPQGGSVDVSSIRYGASLLYHFENQRAVQPFAGLGVGGETINWGNYLAWQRQSRFAPYATLGGSVKLQDGVSLRVRGTRDLTAPENGRPANQLMLTIGLNLRQRVR